jgi:hypothetical protein
MFAPIAPKRLSSTSRAPSLIRRSRGGTATILLSTLCRGCRKFKLCRERRRARLQR